MNKGNIFYGLILSFMLLFFLACFLLINPDDHYALIAKKWFVKGVGISSISVNYPGMALNTAHEGLGLYGILSDIPGGYSYFPDDEKTDPPFPPMNAGYHIEVIKDN